MHHKTAISISNSRSHELQRSAANPRGTERGRGGSCSCRRREHAPSRCPHTTHTHTHTHTHTLLMASWLSFRSFLSGFRPLFPSFFLFSDGGGMAAAAALVVAVMAAAAAAQMQLEPFVDALPVPGAAAAGADGIVHLDMRAMAHRYHRDLPRTPSWGYNGVVPGPTVTAWRGTTLRIRYRLQHNLGDRKGVESKQRREEREREREQRQRQRERSRKRRRLRPSEETMRSREKNGERGPDRESEGKK